MFLACLSVLLACAEPNRSHKSSDAEPEELQNQRQSAERNTSNGKSIPIHLAIGTFDPLLQNGPAALPPELTVESYPEDEVGYYIVQFKGPVMQKWKKEVVSAGVEIFDYIPQFAFIVKMDHQSLKRVDSMDSVRWLGIYQPGYRIAPNLTGMLSAKEDQPIGLVVSIFGGEDVSVLTSKMKNLGGERLEISPGAKRVRLLISSNMIGNLARLSGVRYVEKVPEFKLSPTNNKRGE